MRKPKVKNKYNLTMATVKKLKVINKDAICEPRFWRNNVIGAWCLSGNTVKCQADEEFGTYSSFWIGIYDEDAKAYAGKVRVSFDAYGGMCSYNFKNFYDFSEIEHLIDLEIQEKFLKEINYLLDKQILAIA